METTVIEIPVELKPAFTDLVAACERGRRAAQQNRRLDCAKLEGQLTEAARECERAAMAVIIGAINVDAPRIRVEGKTLFRVGRFETTYHSAAGPIPVERTLYREIRNGPTFDPIAMRLGVVSDTWLPGAADQMSFLLAKGTSREAEKTARKLGRLPFSRSSFERVGHAVGELYVSKHGDIEQELIEASKLPVGAVGIAVSIDRVSVPMEEPSMQPPRERRPKRRRSATKKTTARAVTTKRKTTKRTSRRRRVERNYRMAYCGTVCIVDAEGEVLHTIRYGRMPNGDPVDLAEGIAGDVFALRERQPGLSVTLLADGAPELWGLLDDQLNEKTLGNAPYRLIDFYHLIEKLDAAAKAIYGEEAARPVIRRWKTRLLNAKTGATMILAELRRSSTSSKAVHEAITYIENNGDRMNYATACSEGRPIGSGAVEATCKSLVALRMKRAGSRWKEDTGEHIIQLRALFLSDRWDAGIQATLRPLRKTVRRAA